MSFVPLYSSLKTAGIRPTVRVEKNSKIYEFYGCEKARYCETTGEIVAFSSNPSALRGHVKLRAASDDNNPECHFEIYDLNCEAAAEIDGNTMRIVFPQISKWTIHPFVLPVKNAADQDAKWSPPPKIELTNNTTLQWSLNKWNISPTMSIVPTTSSSDYSHHFYGDVKVENCDTDHGIYASSGVSKLHLLTNVQSGLSSSQNPYAIFYNGPLTSACNVYQKTTWNVFPSAHYTMHFVVKKQAMI